MRKVGRPESSLAFIHGQVPVHVIVDGLSSQHDLIVYLKSMVSMRKVNERGVNSLLLVGMDSP